MSCAPVAHARRADVKVSEQGVVSLFDVTRRIGSKEQRTEHLRDDELDELNHPGRVRNRGACICMAPILSSPAQPARGTAGRGRIRCTITACCANFIAAIMNSILRVLVCL
eukprot:2047927-Pyramimonas_sp.AAC.1